MGTCSSPMNASPGSKGALGHCAGRARCGAVHGGVAAGIRAWARASASAVAAGATHAAETRGIGTAAMHSPLLV
jgi:hypothetical protein